MNPFKTNTMPIDRMPQLLYRENEIQQIKNNIDDRKQTVVLGVEGVGKTSILKCVFNRAYRIQKANEGTLISSVTEFPTDLKSDEIYLHFAEMIISSVGILSQCEKTDEMNEILKKCKEIREEKHSPELYFEKIVKLIYNDYEYHIVMVVDNFERFTSSKEVTMKHHETLRKLLNYSQYIVATNYDLNEDSLPDGVSGSLLLMNFAGNEIRISGWSAEQSINYFDNCLKEKEIDFSKQLQDKLFNLTGGIPLLLNLAAHFAFEYIKLNNTEVGLTFKSLYDNVLVQTLFCRWCKMITPMQVTAIRHLLEGTYDNDVDERKLRCLYLRGILNYNTRKDDFGNTIVFDKEYLFCCRLFGRFCNENGKLEQASSENPLKKSVDESTNNSTVNEMSVEDLLVLLRNKIEEGNASKEQIINMTKVLGQYMPNVTSTIDLNEELSNEVLKKYFLTREIFAKFDPKVQDFLYVGIQMDRCFENVSISNFDYSTVYLSFFKALETHLNLTLVPVMKKVSPDATDDKGRTLSSLDNSKTLMLGSMATILTKRQSGAKSRVVDLIKQRCRLKNLTRYTNNEMWDKYEDMLPKIAITRNHCPHTSMLRDDQGKKFLQEIFGHNGNPEKSFMMRMLNIYTDIMATYDSK